MSVGAPATTATTTHAARDVVSDFVTLSKLRIVVMELITVMAGFLLVGSDWAPLALFAALIGTGLVAASASSLNQLLEIERDALMSRTRNRPLPAGRMSPATAVLFAIVTGCAGLTVLAATAPLPATVAGVVCWLVYVVLYTPLKSRSTLNTFVGAISGGLPILLGWLAADGSLAHPAAWGIFLVLVLWQYPHFMAIAWRCRDDYRAAGYVMDTTVDPTGKRAGRIAIVGSLLLLIAVLLPLTAGASTLGAVLSGSVAIVLTLLYLRSSLRFAASPNDDSSRHLLRLSLVYLPAWLLSLTLLAI